MRPFWHPLSAVLLPEGETFAPPLLLRRLLRRPRTLLYAGDRMWPSVRDGDRVECRPLEGSPALPGEAVIAAPAGIPDLLRVDKATPERARLRADAEPGRSWEVEPRAVLARTSLPRRRVLEQARRLRRLRIDLREALRGDLEREDPSLTVRDKYETQAPFYRTSGGEGAEVVDLVARLAPAGGRIVVAGSGTGRECLALARAGREVCGIDFAPAMVQGATEAAEAKKLPADFRLADLRSHEEPPGSCATVLFTYDVYSFVAERAHRVALLRRMRAWLRPGGVILLSARRAGGAYGGLLLSLQYLRSRRRPRCWGSSHTRWLAPDGRMHRSFVQVFTETSLLREIADAGLSAGGWHGGHRPLHPLPDGG